MNFPRIEFERRYGRLRETMVQNGLDALLVTHEANFNYFTGFIVAHPWASFSRNLIALLPRERPPALIVPAFLESEARSDSWIDQVYPTTTIGAAPIDVIARACRDLGLARARIGAELGYEQRLGVSHADFDLLQAELPAATFVDAAAAIWQLRTIKSDAEIACLRDACEITDVAFEQLFGLLSPGMTEREVTRRMSELLIKGGADRIGWIMVTSGSGQYHRTFGNARDRVPRNGEMLWLDVSAIVNGYGADYDRAGVVGGPTREQQEVQESVHQATMAGVRAIRPGVPVRAVVEAVNEDLVGLGLTPLNSGRIGHGLGLLSSEPPDVSLTDPTVLAPGMVITVEPAIVRDDGIYQVEQDVVVRAAGYEILSQSPHHLRTL